MKKMSYEERCKEMKSRLQGRPFMQIKDYEEALIKIKKEGIELEEKIIWLENRKKELQKEKEEIDIKLHQLQEQKRKREGK